MQTKPARALMLRNSLGVQNNTFKLCRFFMWKFLSESKFLGKLVVILAGCFAFWLMQSRLENTQKALAQKEEQCIILQNANKKQQENITRLLQEQAKQEKLLVQAEQEKEKLVQAYHKKLAQVHQSTDTASQNWKQTKIPESILQILKQK